MQPALKQTSREKILLAALSVIRGKGYNATTVDDLCVAAGVTKGAFFHHFKTKEDLGVAAANYWSEMTGALFANAPYHAHLDPLDRLLGYIDFRKSLLNGEIAEFTCLVGTMLQEIFDSSPAIRDAAARAILDHSAKVEADIQAAIADYGIHPAWTAKSLALHTQAVLQGAFILAKTGTGAPAVADSIDHLRHYVELLFEKSCKQEGPRK